MVSSQLLDQKNRCRLGCRRESFKDYADAGRSRLSGCAVKVPIRSQCEARNRIVLPRLRLAEL